MAKRYFNWKLAVIMLLMLMAAVVTAVSLRQWFRTSNAEQAYQTGLEAFAQGNWQQAATDLGKYIVYDHTDKDILYKYAEALLNIRPIKLTNIPFAMGAYRDILLLDATEKKASIGLIEICFFYQLSPDFRTYATEAETVAQKALLHDEQDSEIRVLLARSLRYLHSPNEETLNEAMGLFKNIVDDDPEYIKTYQHIVDLVKSYPDEFRDEPSAEDWLNIAIENNPESAKAYLNRASYFMNLNLDQAKKDIVDAEKFKPTDVDTLLQLAYANIVISELDKAEKYLKQAQQLDSHNAQLWHQWAVWAWLKQDLTRMTQIAKEGLEELEYQRWDFMTTAIYLYIVTDHLDDAEKEIGEAQDQAEDFMTAQMEYFKGLIARQKKQNYKANLHFQKAVRDVDPDRITQEMRILGYSELNFYEELFESYFTIDDPQTGLFQLRKLAYEKPRDANIQYMYGRFLYRANRWSEAAKQAQEANKLDPTNNQITMFLISTQMQFIKENDTTQWQELDARLAELAVRTGDSIDVLNLQYQSALQQKQMERARQLIQNPKFQSTDLQAKLFQINILLTNDEVDQAISELKSLEEQYPEEILPVMYLAQELVRQDRSQEAIDIFQNAMARFESQDIQLNIVIGLSDLLVQQDRIPEAIDLIQPAIDRNDNSVTQRALIIYYSKLLQAQGELTRSIEVLEDLAEKTPEDIVVRRRIINHPEMARNQSGAQLYVDEIKEQEGSEGWQWRYEQSLLWYNSEDFENYYTQIVTLLNKNLSANSVDQASRLLLAAVYEKRSSLLNENENDGEKQSFLRLANDTYLEAYAHTPDNIEVIYKTVDALNRSGEKDRAAVILNRASQVKLSNSAIELDFKGRLALGQLGLGNVDSSINILENVSSDYPENRPVRLLLADIQINNNDFSAAKAYLDQLRSEDPQDLLAAELMVKFYIKRKNNDQALNTCQQLIDTLGSASAYVLRARTYLQLEQPGPAETDYVQALSLEPKSTVFLTEISEFYRVQERYQEAADAMIKALAIDENNLLIRKRSYQLYLILKQAGKPDLLTQTHAMLEQDRNTYPDDLELDMLKVQYLVGPQERLANLPRSALEQAKELLREMIEVRSDVVEPWLILCNITRQENKPTEALSIVEDALKQKPDDVRLLLIKADILSQQDPSKAEPIFERIHQLFPDDINYVVFLASSYMTTGQPDRAITTLQEVLNQQISVEEQRIININLARAKYYLGLKEEALEEFNQLFLAQPEDNAAPMSQILLLIEDQQWASLMDKFPLWYELSPHGVELISTAALRLSSDDDNQVKQRAVQAYQWLLNKEQENVNVLLGYALLLHSLNQKDLVEKQYLKILELDQKNLTALNNYAWILCEEKNEYDNALILADRGLQIKPDYIDLIDTRGVIYYRRGEWAKAIQDFRVCVESYPRHITSLTGSYYHLGRAQEKNNQKNDAINNLKSALDLNESIGGLSPEDKNAALTLYQKLIQGV